jgi:hypothetical protein
MVTVCGPPRIVKKSSVAGVRLAWPNQISVPPGTSRSTAAASAPPPVDSSTTSNGP